MKIRIVSLLLLLVLTLLLVMPFVRADAAAESDPAVEQLQQQIRKIYAEARRRSGFSSFNGWCGSLVNWQTYLLGIDSAVHGCDGKNEYDMYARMDTTCGGYKVKSYPVSQYTMKEALNAITRNGTVDAYNILVGFQKTNTRLGSIYGHALMIHGIIDGTIYFMECFTMGLGGKVWAEGAPVSCSIDTFCDYYARWTVYEGMVYFGVKTYAQMCTEYPTDMTAMAIEDMQILSEPVDPGINEAKAVVGSLDCGQLAAVTGLYKTPEGAYWYQLDLQGVVGYVPAEKLTPLEQNFDTYFSDVRIPSTARRGVGVVMRGSVNTLNSKMTQLQILVHDEAGQEQMHAQMDVDGKGVALNDWKLDKDLTFRNLDKGTYQIRVLATLENTQLQGGQPVTVTKTLEVWNSQLEIILDWNQYYTVRFDGNGGALAYQQGYYVRGSTLTQTPDGQREGYRLVGWSLSEDGSDPVTLESLPEKDVTLYAIWQAEDPISASALSNAHNWRREPSADGTGQWCTAFSYRFFLYHDGSVATGWTQVDGQWYYLNRGGKMLTGWLETEDGRYFLREDGTRVDGWQVLEDKRCYFAEDGKQQFGWLELEDHLYYLDTEGAMVTGWAEVAGQACHFGEDGVLQLLLQGGKDSGYYVVYDRSAADAFLPNDASMLLG